MLAYWDPFAEMSRIHDRFFTRNNGVDRDSDWKPAVDIYEDKAGIHVRADLAGVKPEDIKVNVENNVLTVSGERKLENEEKRDAYHRVERFYGSFSRSFALTDEVDAEDIDAKYDNGVLTVSLKKRPTAKRREIAVKAA
jgi:HSP20 family protein